MFTGLESRSILLARKIKRRLNMSGIFFERGHEKLPRLIIAGYTRSGTTYLCRVLSNILGSRPVHEPERPGSCQQTGYFYERESSINIKRDSRYQNSLREIFGPGFRGSRMTNTGSRIFYRGRIVKVVRCNHYLDYLSAIMPEQRFVYILRHPGAVIASRIRKGWALPDHSRAFEDVAEMLTTRQRELFNNVDTTAGKLAVSWCLDNVSALANSNNSNFLFVQYEDLVLRGEETLSRILAHMGVSVSNARIRKEINSKFMQLHCPYCA